MPNFKEFIKGFEEPEAKPEQPLANDEAEKNHPENPRLQKIVEERVRRGYDSKGTHDPRSIRDTGYLGYGSLDALEKATFEQEQPKPKPTEVKEEVKIKEQPQPKQGSFEAVFKDMAKPEEGLGDFRPSEPIDDYQSGAKTHSENEFRLEALNDRGMYDYIMANRDRLYRKANVDPEGAIRDIVSRAEGKYGIEPKNIRKDWAMKVLNSFYEDEKAPDLSKPAEFKPSDQIEKYDDSYDTQTRSERDLNVGTANDEGAYNYINNHKEALLKEAQYDPENVLRKIALHADHWDYFSRVKADSVRPDYLLKVISGINPED